MYVTNYSHEIEHAQFGCAVNHVYSCTHAHNIHDSRQLYIYISAKLLVLRDLF